MRQQTRDKTISILMAFATFASVVYWYRFASTPLSQAEVEKYLSVIQAQTQTHPVRHDMVALRQFLEKDDGRPFYTVNLYQFNQEAAYDSGSQYNGTGTEAYDRFSSTMLKLLAARASHPIFGSRWTDPYASGWDRVVIVRYRSRRDIADLFASAEFAAASEHKWASIKRNERMLVQGLHLPGGLIFAMAMAVFVFLITKTLLAIVGAKRPTAL